MVVVEPEAAAGSVAPPPDSPPLPLSPSLPVGAGVSSDPAGVPLPLPLPPSEVVEPRGLRRACLPAASYVSVAVAPPVLVWKPDLQVQVTVSPAASHVAWVEGPQPARSKGWVVGLGW